MENQNSTVNFRLLFVTQVVDHEDPVLGFVIRWIKEFVSQGAKLTVFARKLKPQDLPVSVIGLDLGQPKIRRILKLWYHSIKHRRDYDVVLVHMTPEILVLGWPIWALLGKRVYLWYMHRSVTWWLKAALWMSRKAFTGSDLSLRVDTPKKVVVGHGIDTEQFKPLDVQRQPEVLWISRIQPRKRLEDSLNFMSEFRRQNPDVSWTMRIIGSAQDHEDYLADMQREAGRLGIADRIKFEGPMEHDVLPDVFAKAAAFISTSQTGSLDKVVLESLACGTPVLAKGEEYAGLQGVVSLADQLSAFSSLRTWLLDPKTDQAAQEGIIKQHNLRRLITRLVQEMK
ncbi:MAG: glycosyltransferase family 4 protein [Patescibacteria group bacterium]|nr:glycosyltransferase family 4 protein [Patescibacteria group bacterium]